MSLGRRSIAEMVGTFVSVGLWLGGRFPGRDVPAYIAAQVAGALLAGGVLYAIASGAPEFSPGGRLRGQRGRRPFAGWLYPAVGWALRAGAHVRVLVGHHGRHRSETCARGIRPARDRIGADAHTSHQHPGDQHMGGLLYRALAARRFRNASNKAPERVVESERH